MAESVYAGAFRRSIPTVDPQAASEPRPVPTGFFNLRTANKPDLDGLNGASQSTPESEVTADQDVRATL